MIDKRLGGQGEPRHRVKPRGGLALFLSIAFSAVAGPAHAQAPAQAPAAGQSAEAEWTQLRSSIALANRRGDYEEMAELAARELAFAERAFGPDHDHTLSALRTLALTRMVQNRLAEAEPLVVRALELAERTKGRDDRRTLTVLNDLAGLYQLEGRYAEAEPLYVRGLADSERRYGRNDDITLSFVTELATLYSQQDRNAEAEPLLVRAVDARTRLRGPDDLETLESVAEIASLYRDQGRFAEAEPLSLRVLRAEERRLGQDHPNLIIPINNLAAIYADQRRFAEADALYLRALHISQRVFGADHTDTIFAAAQLTSERLEAGGPALAPARLVASGLRTRRIVAPEGGFAEAQSGREQDQYADYFQYLANAAWNAAVAGADRQPLTAEAFAALQDATADTTDRAVAQMAVRHIADERGAGLGALVREREGLNAAWAANRQNFSAALADADATARRQALDVEREQIQGRMAGIDERLRHDFPEYFALIRPEALDLTAAQALLEPDEAILMIVPTGYGTHVVAISRTNVQWVRSDWRWDQVQGAVGHLLQDVRSTLASGGDRYSFDRQISFDLYQQIVAPVAATLEGKRHVFVAADGSLGTIPFGILVTEPPLGQDSDPQALRDTHWFADAHALTQIPSIQSLQFLRRPRTGANRTAESSGGFVGIGNPVLQGPSDPAARLTCTRGGSGTAPTGIASAGHSRSGAMIADVSLLRHLCPLPGTAAELESMRTEFGAPASSLFVGPRATESILRHTDLSNARILVFATHGLVAGALSGAEPGLVLTPPAIASDDDDGYLAASDVTTLRLDADWVILSACNTATGDGAGGAPGLSGLSRAFFYAGARNLLASHWDVIDEVGAKLTVGTINLQRQRPELSRAQALQLAMRNVRNDPAHPEWAHPAVWAPFSLIGDGAH